MSIFFQVKYKLRSCAWALLYIRRAPKRNYVPKIHPYKSATCVLDCPSNAIAHGLGQVLLAKSQLYM